MFSQTGQKKIIAIGFQQALEILSNQPEVEAPPTITYLLDDQFPDDQPAPIETPRTALPGPGTGTVTENDGQLSISGGKLVVPAQSTPNWNDLGMVYDGFPRLAGRTLIVNSNFSTLGAGGLMGFGSVNGLNLNADHDSFNFKGGGPNEIYYFNKPGEPSNIVVSTLISTGVNYNWSIVLRTSGSYVYVKGGSFSNWTLLYIDNTKTYAIAYPVFNNYNHSYTSDYIRIPDTLSENLDTAQAYDNFTNPTTVAADSGSNGLNGTVVNCGLSGPSKGMYFDGLSTYVNLLPSGLDALLDPAEFGIIFKGQVPDPASWGGSTKYAIEIRTNTNNRIYLYNTTPNISLRYRANNITKIVAVSTTSTDLKGYGMSVSAIADEMKGFSDGSQVGATQTALGVWQIGAYSTMLIGATQIVGSVWEGFLKNVIITLNGIVPTDVQMQYYTNPANPITAAQLDTDFGPGNWAWWKLDEQHQSLATGPESQSLTQYAHNGQTPRIASGNMSVSPVLGSELDSGTLTVGKWYKITATQVDYFYTGCAINDTFIARAATALDANNKVQQIDIDTSIALLDYNDTNTWFSIDPTITARTQSGKILRASSLTGLDTASYLHVYCNLVDNLIYVDQVTAGAVTPVTNNAFTYSAGKRLIAWLSGTTLRVYYNETFLFETTVADTGNTIHGAFATHENTQWGEIQVVPVVNTTLAAQFDQYIP